MAYFRLESGRSGGSAGVILTVNYSEDFYGVTLTATNGTTTLTKTATSSGSVDFVLSEGGTWVVSGTVGGDTYSVEQYVEMEFEKTLEALPNGSTATPTNDIQTWLKCAQIKDKAYTTLAEVLNDRDTFEALCADSNACDYMARSTEWALAEGIVPVMTSNTTPSGVASGNNPWSSYADAYKPFDGDDTTGWTTGANNVYDYIDYIRYEFPTAVSIKAFKALFTTGSNVGSTIRTKKFKIQGSIDGSTWDDLYSGSFNIQTAGESNLINGVLSATNTYKYYQILMDSMHNTNTYMYSLNTLQFFPDADITTNPDAMALIGKFDYCANKLLSNAIWAEAIASSSYFESVLNVKVPNMTSNTTPSGVASAGSKYNSAAYDYYKAFDGAYTTQWASDNNQTEATQWLKYEFPSAVKIIATRLTVTNINTTAHPKTFKIQASNDDSVWTDLYTGTTTNDTAGNSDLFTFTNNNSYKYYRLKITDTWSGGVGFAAVGELQFYGRTDTMIPLVPKMTSNTTPSGEASGKDILNTTSYQYFYPFTGDDNQQWVAGSTNSWLQYELPTAKVAKRLYTYNVTGSNRPWTGTLKGSNTANENDWTTLASNINGAAGARTYVDFENNTAYKYYRLYVESTGSLQPLVTTMQLYTSADLATQVLFRSAAQDDLYYMYNGSPVIIAHTDDNGYAIVDRELLPEGVNLTVYSTVAKDPENLGNAYSRVIHFSKYLTEVYMLPLLQFNVIYWYGFKNNFSGTLTPYFSFGGYSNPAVIETTNALQGSTNAGASQFVGFTTQNVIDFSNYTKVHTIGYMSNVHTYAKFCVAGSGDLYNNPSGVASGTITTSLSHQYIDVTNITGNYKPLVYSAYTATSYFYNAMWLE